jgi:hypothetical protein
VQVLNLGNAPFSFQATLEGPQAPAFRVTPSTGTVNAVSDPTGAHVALTITVDRGSLQAGTAVLKIGTTDQTPPQEIDVQLDFNDDPNRAPREVNEVQVGAFQTAADGSLRAVAQTIAKREDGFAYTIANLREGDYYVYAVGDDNNDGTFSADVESFGAYPTRDVPTKIHVDGKGRVEAIDFGIDSAFIVGIVGGVGAPCTDKNDCTFLPDADCIDSFTGGYCSRICDDPQCGTTGSCEQLQCTDDAGNPFDYNVCLQKCVSDAQCRFDEGYTCDRGACVPAGF